MHGFLARAPQMQVPNILLTISGLAIVVFVLRDRGQRILPQLIMPLAVALALSG